MEHISNEILDLIIAYHGGGCTDADKERLDRWVLSDPANERAFRRYMAVLNDLALTGDHISRNCMPVLRRGLSGRKSGVRRIAGIAAAVTAAAAVIAGVVMLFLNDKVGLDGGYAPIANDITVLLPDGREVALGNSQDGVLITEGDASIVRKDGTLALEARSDDAPVVEELQWVTLKVPAGKTTDFVLGDGSRVWLNANSRLHFPVKFAAGERRVSVDGEFYFDVAKDDGKPFIVETPRQSLTVLGTQFNLDACRGMVEHATLVEGSVQVDAGGKAVTLAPGQQASLAEGAQDYTVKAVDTGIVTAWRRGIFVFDGDTLGDVFEKLARWYGIDYRFEDEAARNLVFRGNLRQQENIDVIFNAIEMSGQVEIKVADKGGLVNIKTR